MLVKQREGAPRASVIGDVEHNRINDPATSVAFQDSK
jgi:hypothetical protein